MAIYIKQRAGKWVLEIKEELWQFETGDDFHNVLESLLEFKSKYGNIKDGK